MIRLIEVRERELETRRESVNSINMFCKLVAGRLR